VPITNARQRPRTLEMLTPGARYSRQDLPAVSTRKAASGEAARPASVNSVACTSAPPPGAGDVDPIERRKSRRDPGAAVAAAHLLPCHLEVGVC
jgi:hypothetical protein